MEEISSAKRYKNRRDILLIIEGVLLLLVTIVSIILGLVRHSSNNVSSSAISVLVAYLVSMASCIIIPLIFVYNTKYRNRLRMILARKKRMEFFYLACINRGIETPLQMNAEQANGFITIAQNMPEFQGKSIEYVHRCFFEGKEAYENGYKKIL